MLAELLSILPSVSARGQVAARSPLLLLPLLQKMIYRLWSDACSPWCPCPQCCCLRVTYGWYFGGLASMQSFQDAIHGKCWGGTCAGEALVQGKEQLQLLLTSAVTALQSYEATQ